MPSFEEMFVESKGQPIIYNGKILQLVDLFPTQGIKSFRLTVEKSTGDWRQGVSIRIRKKGRILINGQHVKQAVCWRDVAPKEVVFSVVGDVEGIEIKNVWDVGDGVMHSWHNGAAMIVEELSAGRRYQCNDGFPDDDFDDIIFRIEQER